MDILRCCFWFTNLESLQWLTIVYLMDVTWQWRNIFTETDIVCVRESPLLLRSRGPNGELGPTFMLAGCENSDDEMLYDDGSFSRSPSPVFRVYDKSDSESDNETTDPVRRSMKLYVKRISKQLKGGRWAILTMKAKIKNQIRQVLQPKFSSS